MFLDGYIGAPPTSTVISAKEGESTAPPSAAKLMAAANAASRTANMQFLQQTWCCRPAGSDEPWRRHVVGPGLITANWARCKSCARRLVPLVYLADPATRLISAR